MVKVVGNYKLLRTLGEGAFSKVKRAVNMKTNKQYAIKVIDRAKIVENNLEKQLEREINIMSQMNHPGLIRLHEIMKSDRNYYLVLDLAEGGELFNKLAQDGPLPENTARKYFQQLIDALEYMHSKGAIHRDLKPENLLLDADGNLKIADFGLSIMAQSETQLLKTRCGTPNYVAPCIFSADGYAGPPADIWSAGLILYVMLCAALPFDAPTIPELARQIMNVQITYPSSIPPLAKDLLTKIIVADPARRYTIKQIKEHPWFIVNYKPTVTPQTENVCSKSEVSVRKEPDGDEIDAFSLIAKMTQVNIGKLVDNSINVNASTSFSSPKSTEEIISTLQTHLSKLRANVTLVRNQPSLKAVVPVSSNSVSIRVDVCRIADSLNLVEFCRIKGPQFDFLRVYRSCKQQLQ